MIAVPETETELATSDSASAWRLDVYSAARVLLIRFRLRILSDTGTIITVTVGPTFGLVDGFGSYAEYYNQAGEHIASCPCVEGPDVGKSLNALRLGHWNVRTTETIEFPLITFNYIAQDPPFIVRRTP